MSETWPSLLGSIGAFAIGSLFAAVAVAVIERLDRRR